MGWNTATWYRRGSLIRSDRNFSPTTFHWRRFSPFLGNSIYLDISMGIPWVEFMRIRFVAIAAKTGWTGLCVRKWIHHHDLLFIIVWIPVMAVRRQGATLKIWGPHLTLVSGKAWKWWYSVVVLRRRERCKNNVMEDERSIKYAKNG